MTRKALMIAAIAAVALTSSISIGSAQANWVRHPAWHYYHPGWRYYRPGWPYRGSAYYRVRPRCFVTVYGVSYCY